MAAFRRVVLHFDYDCFYAQVVQNLHPDLAGRCVGVTQKSILATCNYAARRRGVRKLMRIADARRVCPDLVLVDGEDLSPFRDASKRLFCLVRNIIGQSIPPAPAPATATTTPVERLGLDELFLDVTDLVAANLGRLETLSRRSEAFFELPSDDDVPGFAFDGRSFSGCVVGNELPDDDGQLAFLVASHLAAYLRSRLADAGYTSSAGIAANKVLAKLAGKQNKPANQTTLLSSDDVVASFMDPLPLRSVPWIGSRTTSLLEDYIQPQQLPLTVGLVRQHPGMSPRLLETLLGTDAAARIWALLHGIDDTPVRPASDLPAQISIEDTYGGPRRRLLPGSAGPVSPAVAAELHKLAVALLRRMHVDLLRDDGDAWRARPRTLRLTLRPQPADPGVPGTDYHRASRSQPLPGYVLSLTTPLEHTADRLVTGCLAPLYRRLAAAVEMPRQISWTVGLLNVCVANMAPMAEGDGIAALFRRVDHDPDDHDHDDHNDPDDPEDPEDPDPEDLEVEDDLTDWPDVQACPQCGRLLPSFARAAHARFHLLGD